MTESSVLGVPPFRPGPVDQMSLRITRLFTTDQVGDRSILVLRSRFILMAVMRSVLVRDIRSGSTLPLCLDAAAGSPLGCCRRGRCLRCRLCLGSDATSRSRSSSTLRRPPGSGDRRGNSLLTRCMLKLGVLLAQPQDGTLQLDDLLLEFRLARLRCGGGWRLSGCRAHRARNSCCFRRGGNLRPVLRAERTAKSLPGCWLSYTLHGLANRLGRACHRCIHDEKFYFRRDYSADGRSATRTRRSRSDDIVPTGCLRVE